MARIIKAPYVEQTFTYEAKHVPSGHVYPKTLTLEKVLELASGYGDMPKTSCGRLKALTRHWNQQGQGVWKHRLTGATVAACKR